MFDIDLLHQKLIHFPIAFLMIYPFIEISSFIKKSIFTEKLSFFLLTVGILGLISAIISGNMTLNKYDNITEIQRIKVDQHIDFATYTTLLASALFIVKIYFRNILSKNNLMRFMIILLAMILLFLVYKTGEYGAIISEFIHQNR